MKVTFTLDSTLRINYVLVSYNAKSSGVFKKIRDQFATWQKMGATPNLFVITDSQSVEAWKSIDPGATILVDSSFIKKVLNRAKIVKMAQKSNPEVIYLRDSFPIRIPRTTSSLCLEVQSLYGSELLIRSRFKYLAFKFLSGFIYRNVEAVVYVSQELMQKNEINLSNTTKKIVVANGIDLARIESLPIASKTKPALFFVGHPGQNWHGISDLIEFASVSPDLDFHLVGYEQKFNLPNVKSYGLLTYEDYRSIAQKCSVGIGSLKLEATGMSEASPLKTREYLAMGLPVITRYLDTDFPQCPDFILRLPQTGQPLEGYSSEIRKFIEFWGDKRVTRDRIAHLDVHVKEKTRLGFLKDFIC